MIEKEKNIEMLSLKPNNLDVLEAENKREKTNRYLVKRCLFVTAKLEIPPHGSYPDIKIMQLTVL